MVHHHDGNGYHLCPYPRHCAYYMDPELYYYGLQPARRLRMVVGCNTFLTAHSPQQRANKVWLSHLCTHHLSMLYGHHFPHSSCPKRLCKPHLSAHFAGCYRMAMAGDKPLQQETSRQRCRLCLYFFSCLSGERRSLSGRIHAACSRASDMVDDAADLYSHHYLFVEHAEKVCQ